MYKIYINETPLVLSRTSMLSAYSFYAKESVLVVKYTGKTKHLLQYIDLLEKNKKYDSVIIHSDQYDRLKEDFKSLFKRVHAAGGVVKNPKNEVLFIFRKGHWDLPKGKIEKNESRSEAALREVAEETGVKDLTLKSKICKTRHTYKEKKQRFLKVNWWYYMESSGKGKTKPQKSESITKAEWLEPGQLLSSNPIMYRSIKEVLKRYYERFLRKLNAEV